MTDIRRFKYRLAAFAACGAIFVSSACATDRGDAGADEDFPNDTITFIVHAQAGGGSDTTARALAPHLEEILDTDIVVENMTGAGGATALQYVANSEPDGYVIGYMPVELATFPHLGYDIDAEEYDMIGQMVNIPGVLAVPPDSPYENMDELLEAEGASVAIPSVDGHWDIALNSINDEEGAELQAVPFDGDAPSVTAATGGQTEAVIAGFPAVLPAAQEGDLKPLMLFAEERLDELPDVPTAEELGYDLPFGGWGGIGAPAGLPDDVRQTLVDALSEARASQEFISVIENTNSMVVERDGDEFSEFINEQYDLFEDYL